MPSSDTIVALSTPPGRSGIGVVRLSGPAALDIARALTRDLSFNPEPHHASLKSIYDLKGYEDKGARNGSHSAVLSGSDISKSLTLDQTDSNTSNPPLLDQAVITYFKAPNSYTGEDIVELSCHGSPVLLTRVIDMALALDARAAAAGEFTLRALSNGRINLSQAEAIRDLIDAQTESGARQAARQLRGDLSKRLQGIKDMLVEIIVPLESSLEFVEDDLPDIAADAIIEKLERLRRDLGELSSTFQSGRLLKEGLKVTLAGRPNVGKSSIFNRLLASNRAIVTEIAGTTRDSLTEKINLDGVPVQLTDTAGIRTSEDTIEVMGVERTRDAIADADLIVAVLDGSQWLTEQDSQVLAETAGQPRVIVLNKSDLESSINGLADDIDLGEVVRISAKTGEGLDALKAAIMAPFSTRDLAGDNFIITNARHYDLLLRSQNALASAQEHLRQRAPEELVVVGLYDALRYLGEITGETTPDEILGQIFQTFCIGK